LRQKIGLKMTAFVWTKMQAEGGQTLSSILAIKEAERLAGDGIFGGHREQSGFSRP
jgi:hypothetical protein